MKKITSAVLVVGALAGLLVLASAGVKAHAQTASTVAQASQSLSDIRTQLQLVAAIIAQQQSVNDQLAIRLEQLRLALTALSSAPMDTPEQIQDVHNQIMVFQQQLDNFRTMATAMQEVRIRTNLIIGSLINKILNIRLMLNGTTTMSGVTAPSQSSQATY